MTDTFTSLGDTARSIARRLAPGEWQEQVIPVLCAISSHADAARRSADEAKTLAGLVQGKLPAWETFPADDLDRAIKTLGRALDTLRETRQAMSGEGR